MVINEDLKTHLRSLNNLDWFDAVCELLKKKNQPNTRQLESLIGEENRDINRDVRGSKFLIPYDSRFRMACVNPDLLPAEADAPLEYFSIGGEDFRIEMPEVIQRFGQYRITANIYDGGSQVLFYPVPDEFAFAAIACNIFSKGPEEIGDISALYFQQVNFLFGDQLVKLRDGYHMRP